MRIGFFGDSYCDIVYFNNEKYRANPEAWGRQYKPWPAKLLDDYGSPILSSGLGGSCLFDSITKWNNDNFKDTYNVVLWSLTWHNRLYTSDYFQPVFLAKAERRPIPISDIPGVNYEEISQGIDLYYKYLYDDNQQKFYHEQLIKWILNLPTQYPNIKFIFLPCTEYSRKIAKNNFINGTLLDFSFETISNLEPNSPGAMPIMCNRLGHLNDHNHECMTDIIKNIINNYENFHNTLVKPDFSAFDLREVPKFD